MPHEGEPYPANPEFLAVGSSRLKGWIFFSSSNPTGPKYTISEYLGIWVLGGSWGVE